MSPARGKAAGALAVCPQISPRSRERAWLSGTTVCLHCALRLLQSCCKCLAAAALQVFGCGGSAGRLSARLEQRARAACGCRYAGSADAVRRNLPTILEQYRGAGVPDELLIISGEAIYQMVRMPPGLQNVCAARSSACSRLECRPRQQGGARGAWTGPTPAAGAAGAAEPRTLLRQDFGDMIRRHREMDADITLCSCSVTRENASKRGLVRVDPHTGGPPRSGSTQIGLLRCRSTCAEALGLRAFVQTPRRPRMPATCGLAQDGGCSQVSGVDIRSAGALPQ